MSGDRWAVWGSGDVRFGGDFDGFRQDGTVLSGYLGADYRFAPNALAGLAASYSSLDLTSTTRSKAKPRLRVLVNVYRYGLGMPESWESRIPGSRSLWLPEPWTDGRLRLDSELRPSAGYDRRRHRLSVRLRRLPGVLRR